MKISNVLLFAFILLVAWSEYALASSKRVDSKDLLDRGNNRAISECLEATGYDKSLPVEKRLNNFDWNSASSCYSTWSVEKRKSIVQKLRDDVSKRPWLKGPNWRWELYAEYDCKNEFREEVNADVIVCHKPYYLDLE